jgi:hypothetical protein
LRLTAAFFATIICIRCDPAAAQQPSGIYMPGNAAVTGFSGDLPPIQIAPGVDPNQLTFIDPNGPALRVIDLQHMGGPPGAQLIGAPKPFTVSASLIGQVFGVAIDDSSPPNIYAAATSIYGLPIVAPAGTNGQLVHVASGAPSASFMSGLWGQQGGPGSIWKIDGASGQVSRFANVTTNGRANSGAALGGLAYDPVSKSLLVADRETGLIHRFGPNGIDLGTYDHGVAGRNAVGLTPVPWTAQSGIDVTNSNFDSTQPSTWDYAAPQRLVFGLAVYQHRMYYGVADSLQVWSVGLNADGSFASDPRIEIAAPPSTGSTEISAIAFDEQGRMYLAERPAPTGAFDFEVLSVPSVGRSLRYAIVGMTVSGQPIWQQAPDEYAIGFPGDFRNDNGGVAIGYSYNDAGDFDLASCGGFLWSTGEQLRSAADPALAAQLAKSGQLYIDGLQGNPTWRIKRDDEPPLVSYFIDYADEYADPASHGHMGAVAIIRPCTPAKAAAFVQPTFPPPFPSGMPPGYPPNPPRTPPPPPIKPPVTPVCMPWQICGPGGNPICPPNQVIRRSDNSCNPSCDRPSLLVNGQCCEPSALASGTCGNSSCPAGQTAVGPSNFCCNSALVYKGKNGGPACCSGSVVNGQCQPPTPPSNNCLPGSTNPQCCPKGYVSTGGSCCLSSQMTSTGVCCPSGEIPDGINNNQCVPLIKIPIGPRCCSSGLVPAGNGSCCPAANLTTSGACCSGPVNPKNRTVCPVTTQRVAACAAGYTKMPNGSCCNNRYIGADGKSCNTGEPSCPAGQFRALSGTCAPIVTTTPPPCSNGEVRNDAGNCVPPSPPAPPGPPTACPRGEVRNNAGNCVPPSPPPPPPPVTSKPQACPRGQVRNDAGKCVAPPKTTPPLPPRLAPTPRFNPPARPIGPAGGGFGRRL